MEQIPLEVEVRVETGRSKVDNLRDAGFVPAVIYGEGHKPVAVKVTNKSVSQLVHTHHFEHAIISVQVKGAASDKRKPCLIKEIQYEPVHGTILHVDFLEISLSKEIKVNVPITAKGESVGVKNEGGSLEHILWEVEVECLPTAIPKDIEVDITPLKIGDSIHVRDLVAPAGVKFLNDPGSIVLTVAAPMKEEAPAEAVEGEAASQEPEVIKEKKPVAEEAPAEGKEKK